MAMADICFPNDGLSGDNGHDPNDVLYIGFPTKDAFPKGAKWNARTTKEFQDSIKSLGDQLVAKLRVSDQPSSCRRRVLNRCLMVFTGLMATSLLS